MRAEEFVTEVLNTPAVGTWDKAPKWAGMDKFLFTASNGVQYRLDFLDPVIGPDEMGPESFDFTDNLDAATWDKVYDGAKFIEFEQINQQDPYSTGKQGVEGTGAAAEVFGIVSNAILAYIKKYRPSMLYFQAVEPNRRRLYASIMNRLLRVLPGWAVEQAGPGNSHFAIYNTRLLKPTPAKKSQPVVTEIERLRNQDYAGGKDEIEYLAKSRAGLAPLPGGSGLLYNVRGNQFSPMIVIWDPQGPDARPDRPQPIGKLSLERADRRVPIPGALQVASITVDEDYRGRGIARSLYGIVLSVMRRPLVAGEMQTPGGRQNWVSLAQIPGVEVRGFVSIDDSTIDADQLYGDNSRGKNIIDTLMGRLGAEYIGRTPYDRHVFAFDVRPGRSEKEMEAVVNTTLSRVYNEHPDVMSGLYAVWAGA